MLKADFDTERQCRNRLIDVAIETSVVFSENVVVLEREIEREHARSLVLDVYFDDDLQYT